MRELNLGEILDQAVQLTKERFGLLIGITAILHMPFNLLVKFAALSVVANVPQQADPIAQQQAMLRSFPVLIPLIMVFYLIVHPVTEAILIAALSNIYLDQPVTFGQAVRQAAGNIRGFLVAGILYALLTFGGYMMCCIPGVIAAIWLNFWMPIVVLEKASGLEALKRSGELITGNIVMLLALWVVSLALMWNIGFGAAVIPQPHVRMVMATLTDAVASIVGTAALVAFYYSCRCKRELFDLVRLAQSVNRETPIITESVAPAPGPA